MAGRSGDAAELGGFGCQRASAVQNCRFQHFRLSCRLSYVRAAAQSDFSLHKSVLIENALCIFLLAKDTRNYSVDGL